MNSWTSFSLVFLLSLLYTLYMNTTKHHICFCCYFDSWDYVSLCSQTGLELAMHIRQESNSQRLACLFLWRHFVSANKILSKDELSFNLENVRQRPFYYMFVVYKWGNTFGKVICKLVKSQNPWKDSVFFFLNKRLDLVNYIYLD